MAQANSEGKRIRTDINISTQKTRTIEFKNWNISQSIVQQGYKILVHNKMIFWTRKSRKKLHYKQEFSNFFINNAQFETGFSQ